MKLFLYILMFSVYVVIKFRGGGGDMSGGDIPRSLPLYKTLRRIRKRNSTRTKLSECVYARERGTLRNLANSVGE